MMKILFLILVCIPTVLFSQVEQNKDKIIESYLDSAYLKYKDYNVTESIRYSKIALNLSKTKNYSSGIAWGSFYIGQSLEGLNTYKQALEFLEKASVENKKLGDQYLNFEIKRVRARIYGSSNLHSNAISENKKALLIIPKIKKTEKEKDFLKALTYENLALTYVFMHKKDSVYYYLKQTEKILEKSDKLRFMPSIINNYTELGDYYASVGKTKEAERQFKKAILLAEANQYPFLSFTFKKYGDLMLKNKKNDSALFYYHKALNISEKTKLKSEFPPLFEKIAYVYQILGKHDDKKRYLLRSLELKDSLKSEMLAASNIAVDTILSEQRESFLEENSQKRVYIIAMGIIVLVLLCYLLFYYKKNKSLKLDKEILNEKESLMIQRKKDIKLRYEEDIKKLKLKSNHTLDEILALAKSNSPEFFIYFQEFHPDFVNILLEKDCNLRVSELTLCAYFYLGFSTKDIAGNTFKSISTIRNRRQNLRTKLNIPADEDLELWFKTLTKNRE